MGKGLRITGVEQHGKCVWTYSQTVCQKGMILTLDQDHNEVNNQNIGGAGGLVSTWKTKRHISVHVVVFLFFC